MVASQKGSEQKGADYGTPELQKRGIHFTGTKDSERVAHTNTQVPLDYYLVQGFISEEQFDAGNEFFRLWYYGAEKLKCSQMRFNREPSGKMDFDTSVKLEELYRAAERSIGGLVTKLIVFNVCCIGEWAGYLEFVGVNRRMKVLRDGLDDLAHHFGIKKRH